jgi:hypothetical protein
MIKLLPLYAFMDSITLSVMVELSATAIHLSDLAMATGRGVLNCSFKGHSYMYLVLVFLDLYSVRSAQNDQPTR